MKKTTTNADKSAWLRQTLTSRPVSADTQRVMDKALPKSPKPRPSST